MRTVEEVKKYEQRWGWLASLYASLIVTLLHFVRAYLKMWFSAVNSGIKVIIVLLMIHLFFFIRVIQELFF